MTESPPSLYDRDDYYASNRQGSRLAPALDGLLRALEYGKLYDVLRQTGLRAGKVLDVGAADGSFLRLLQRRGFTVAGTTLSQTSAKAAQELYGLQLHVSAALQPLVPQGPFDLLSYWHVFEHLDDPAEHRAQWPHLVRAGGFILIEVPNIRSLGAKLCYRSWLGSDDRHHINNQTPETISAWLRAAGFVPTRCAQFSWKFSYVFLWSALLGRLFGRQYDCDSIMALLKKPLAHLRAHPLWTLNAVVAVFYLAPVVLPLIVCGLLTGQGEVWRVYAQHQHMPAHAAQR